MAAADPVGLPCQHVLALPSPCPRLLPRWAFAHLCPSYVLLYLVRPPLPHPPPPFFLQCPPGDPVQPEPLLKRQTQGTQSESPTPSTVLRPQAAHPRGLQAVPPGPAPASSLASSTSHCPSAPFLCQAPGRALEIRSRNLTVPSSRSWFSGCTRTASEKSQASFRTRLWWWQRPCEAAERTDVLQCALEGVALQCAREGVSDPSLGRSAVPSFVCVLCFPVRGPCACFVKFLLSISLSLD